jgi:hypothetical protein
MVVTLPGTSEPRGNVVAGIAFLAFVALLFWRMAEVRTELDEAGLTVVRWVWVRRRVAWSKISDVTVDEKGLHVVLEGGKTLWLPSCNPESSGVIAELIYTDIDEDAARLRRALTLYRRGPGRARTRGKR